MRAVDWSVGDRADWSARGAAFCEATAKNVFRASHVGAGGESSDVAPLQHIFQLTVQTKQQRASLQYAHSG